MTGIHIVVFLLFPFSYISFVCCEVPRLRMEQNKNVFCPGETARLICQWENVRATSWEVNGTVITTGGLNRKAGHNTSTSLTEGFIRVSITQTQPSVTSYTCITTIDDDFPSEVVYVTFRESQLELSISYVRNETSFLVLLNVTSEGCPPLEQVRITVDNESLIGRHNDTFRFEGLSPDVEYPLQVETQVEGEEFGLYKNMTVPVYNTSDGLNIQEVENNSDQPPEVTVAVPVVIVLVTVLVAAAVTCGVIILLCLRHCSDRKAGMHDVILCPDAFQHGTNRQKIVPVSTVSTESQTGNPQFGNGSPIMTAKGKVERIETHAPRESRDMSNEISIECPPNGVNNHSSSCENSSPSSSLDSTDGLLGHYAKIDHNSPHPIAPPPVDNKVVYAKV